MTNKSKPKVFWILQKQRGEYSGVTYPDHISTEPRINEKYIHVIEYSFYESALEEIKRLQGALEDAQIEIHGEYCGFSHSQNCKSAAEALKESRDKYP